MDFIEYLKAELDKAQRAMIEAKTRHETILSMLTKYQSQHSKASSNGTLPTVYPPKADLENYDRITTSENGLNKASEVRRVLIENRLAGVSTNDVIRKLQAKNLDIADTYVYSLISRWKTKGLLENRDNKYFATDDLVGAQKEREE